MNATPSVSITPLCKEMDAPILPPAAARQGLKAKSTNPRTLDSREVLGDQNLVLIQHLGATYRLQSTRQGKLILTK
jgi:hemin uptake protein HemP